MISLHQRLAAVTDRAANLIAQLSELNKLRDQVRKAEQVQSSLRLERSQLTPPLNRSGNRRSVSPS
jgi:hypothetical protein